MSAIARPHPRKRRGAPRALAHIPTPTTAYLAAGDEADAPAPAAIALPRREQPVDIVLNPAVQVLWRARDVVQLELGTDAVVIEGADTEVIRQLVRSAASTAAERVVGRSAHDHDRGHIMQSRWGEALDTLVDQGFLWRVPGHTAEHRMRPPTARLAAELAAMSSRYGASAADLLRARRRAVVAVHGDGRAVAQVGALLAAAGVGRLHVVGTGPARLHQTVPGGICPSDEGQPFTEAVRAAIHRAAPDVDTTPLPIGDRPDVVVLVSDEPVDSEQRDALHARRCTHLAVRLGAGHGVVGPLVVPGRSSCLRCADLHRRDRDHAWTALAVQLATPRRHGPVSDVSLATVIAGVAASQTLAFLDGSDPPTINGTLEMQVPDWRLRRRSWPPHGDCDCGARSAAP